VELVGLLKALVAVVVVYWLIRYMWPDEEQ
jgi:hypothetical protein